MAPDEELRVLRDVARVHGDDYAAVLAEIALGDREPAFPARMHTPERGWYWVSIEGQKPFPRAGRWTGWRLCWRLAPRRAPSERDPGDTWPRDISRRGVIFLPQWS